MSDVLNPVRSVRLSRETVEIKRLRWKDHTQAIKKIIGPVVRLQNAKNPDGSVTLTKELILDAIQDSEETIEWLICRATGKDTAWCNELDASEALDLLTAIIEQNLDQQVIDKAKKAGALLSAILDSKKPSAE